ncbi:hypothetical protein Nepgr_024769 [Nepenthes gracilis]|uniref:Uncharacterized protein n=1 Tax=Nepenthes gracilis TaxID=150966 RepID=A0AAD3T6J1_NEPGR|nr:hypothetical protein Nepgr_024769 [Nepenthes gracilis]
MADLGGEMWGMLLQAMCVLDRIADYQLLCGFGASAICWLPLDGGICCCVVLHRDAPHDALVLLIRDMLCYSLGPADACRLLNSKLEFPTLLLHWIVMGFAGFGGLLGNELRPYFTPGVWLLLQDSLLVGFAYLSRALLLMAGVDCTGASVSLMRSASEAWAAVWVGAVFCFLLLQYGKVWGLDFVMLIFGALAVWAVSG